MTSAMMSRMFMYLLLQYLCARFISLGGFLGHTLSLQFLFDLGGVT